MVRKDTTDFARDITPIKTLILIWLSSC